MAVAELIEYVKSSDREFAERIQGAAESSVLRLQELAGIRLPSIYSEYLRVMGHADGGLDIFWDCESEIAGLIRFYEDEVRTGIANVPPDCVIVGYAGMIFPEFSLHQESTTIFLSAEGKLLKPYAETFEKLLYRAAFITYKLKKFKIFTSHVSAQREYVLPAAQAMCDTLGFKNHWFSDSMVSLNERPDSAISITQFQENGPVVSIAANDARIARHLGNAFQKEFNLELQ